MNCESLIIILPDQLCDNISSLSGINLSSDVVLLAEVLDEASSIRPHAKKLAFQFSAMRHFAAGLRDQGVDVDYIHIDSPENSGSLRTEIVRACHRYNPSRVVVTEASELKLRQMMVNWSNSCGAPVQIRQDDRFFCSPEEFSQWANEHPTVQFVDFYRWLRLKTGLLLDTDGAPVGGRWHFAGLRRRLHLGWGDLPTCLLVQPDEMTLDVCTVVAERYSQHFGSCHPFSFAVTGDDAVKLFEYYRLKVLPFGDGPHHEGGMCFALLSMYLNTGLLEPKVICARLEAEYRSGRLRIEAVEGAIRLILGWREYLRGLYWHFMPDIVDSNALESYGPLPSFFWTGNIEMNCLRVAVSRARNEAFADNLQRLVISGGFALLAGISPSEYAEWCLSVYADTQEWLELPLIYGPVTFAAGTLLSAYPWVLDGRIINQCTPYCQSCRYSPESSSGEIACPFNLLFWNFLIKNRIHLAHQRPFSRAYLHLDGLSDLETCRVRSHAEAFLNSLA